VLNLSDADILSGKELISSMVFTKATLLCAFMMPPQIKDANTIKDMKILLFIISEFIYLIT
jgi:hypothetical protein